MTNKKVFRRLNKMFISDQILWVLNNLKAYRGFRRKQYSKAVKLQKRNKVSE